MHTELKVELAELVFIDSVVADGTNAFHWMAFQLVTEKSMIKIYY